MAGSDQQIISITRTLCGVSLQTTKILGIPFSLVPNTTLNERWDVQAGVAPSADQSPSMRYLAIGNMGHILVKADDGSDEAVPVPHRATDTGLYGQVPFVLREVTSDLPAHLRERFGLRRQETHNGRQYFAYYLLRLPMDQVVVNLQHVTTKEGLTSTRRFQPTAANLNPKRPEISNTGVVVGSDSSESASAVLTIELGPSDINEILNAHLIRTGSRRSPVISEFALVSGVDKPVSGKSGAGGSFTYNEVIAAQVNVFVSTMYALGYATDGVTITLDVGGVEPLLGESSVANAEFATQ